MTASMLQCRIHWRPQLIFINSSWLGAQDRPPVNTGPVRYIGCDTVKFPDYPGRVIMNSSPSFSRLFTFMVPPCTSSAFLTIDSPSPEPPLSRVRP